MNQKTKIVIGEKYNRLTPIEVAGKDKYGCTIYRCVCECGREVVVMGSRMARNKVKSCGCLKGFGVSYTITYASWNNAKERCYSKNHFAYDSYGGRGIKMCERWRNSFENFLEDMGERPLLEYTLDRINVNGDYEPDNCRWATMAKQCNNRRNNHYIDYNGERLTVADFARKYNFSADRLYYELNKGHNIEYILLKYKDRPIKHYKNRKNRG